MLSEVAFQMRLHEGFLKLKNTNMPDLRPKAIDMKYYVQEVHKFFKVF